MRPSEAGDAVTEIVGAGIVPGAIEMMDRLSIRAAEQATGAGYRLDAGAALLIELDGPREECTARFEHVMSLCARAGARDVRVALTAQERELIWKARKAAFAAMGRIAPAYYVQDGVIPRTRLSQVLRRIDALASEYKLQVANVFHAGDGNLHPLVCYDSARPGEPERAEELAGLIVRTCVEEGGSITGEHGVGSTSAAYMPAMFSGRRPRGVSPAALRVRPARARQSRQGDADPATVRRGPWPLPRASARARGRRGADVSHRWPTLRRSKRPQPCSAPPAPAVAPCGSAAAARSSAGARRLPDPAIELRTRRLHRIVEHNVGDLTAVLEAGVPLAAAQEAFAQAGQMLALDPPLSGSGRADATIGGVLASGDSGPLRHRYGGPRDLVLGMTVALSDGTVARSGGKVIKNVAGYDIAKLFVGSFGTLGAILSVNVRLHPVITGNRDRARRDLGRRDRWRPRQSRLAAAPLELDALDIAWRGGRGGLLARTSGAEGARRARRVAEPAARGGARAGRPRHRGRAAVGAPARRSAVRHARARPRGGAPQPARRLVLAAADACGGTLVGRAALGTSYIELEPEAVARLRGGASGRRTRNPARRPRRAPPGTRSLGRPAAGGARADAASQAALRSRRGVQPRRVRRRDLMTAFDTHRPPEQSVLDDCVHCGFCLDACPTYALWAQEADSPRGRIVLIDEALNGSRELSDEMVSHFDSCLGCMACVTACPSGRPLRPADRAGTPADRAPP